MSDSTAAAQLLEVLPCQGHLSARVFQIQPVACRAGHTFHANAQFGARKGEVEVVRSMTTWPYR